MNKKYSIRAVDLEIALFFIEREYIIKYEKIVKATFIERPNRFIAYVSIDGQKETVHVKNTGRCKELLIRGVQVLLV